MGFFTADRDRYRTLASALVTPEPLRCVQCGVCSFNCPMGIDVRRHVWRVEPVMDSACLTCGECVRRCPRGLLRFEPITDAQGQAEHAREERVGAPKALARRSGRSG
jgi:Fe-S oxidoreductase